MAPLIHPLRLAHEIAEIASKTTDAETAGLLLKLADRLLSEAGLPGGNLGGGDLPPGPLHTAPVDLAEFA